MVSICNCRRIVDHHHGYRRHKHFISCHSNHRCCTSRNSINLDSYVAFVLSEHGIDLCCRYTVTTWRVNPNCDISLSTFKFILKNLWSNIIIEPTFCGDCPVQKQSSFRRFRLILPVPELLHFHLCLPPFLHPLLQRFPHPVIWSCFR